MIVHLPSSNELFDVLEDHDLFVLLRHRRSGDEFVVSRRTFREFRTLTHPCATLDRSHNANTEGDTR